MIELGKVQELEILREKEFGVYVGEHGQENAVLLPQKQVPQGAKAGDRVTVFIYKDSSDRLIATTQTPKLQVGEAARLEVRDIAKIGAFLDMGLEKDLFLPFKEQTHPVKKGEKCLVVLYIDKSHRLAATMHVYSHMRNDSPYKEKDWVHGTVYEINEKLGAFVAVDNRYFGLIPKSEIFAPLKEGEEILARVTKVRADGKLNLCLRETAHLQMDADSRAILDALEKNNGFLPCHDKSDPQVILKTLGMSKNAFKRAAGRLLKEQKIQMTDTGIRRMEKNIKGM